MRAVFAPHRFGIHDVNIVHRAFPGTQTAAGAGVARVKGVRLHKNLIENGIDQTAHRAIIEIVPRSGKSFPFVKVQTPDEFRHHFTDHERKYSPLQALSPYAFILVLLPLIRYGFPAVVENGFAVMCTFGYISWVDLVIMICGILGALVMGVNFKTYCSVCKKTAKHVLPVLITMSSLLVVSYIMQSDSTGMMNLIASDAAKAVGRLYPAAAVAIGASGSFITGTGLGSNIMFADMHMQAAEALSMNPITIFAGQNAGASLGNMICPNNTVAACATVDQVGRESEVMKKTLPAFAIILVIYMALAMLYTCVLFPNFGA